MPTDRGTGTAGRYSLYTQHTLPTKKQYFRPPSAGRPSHSAYSPPPGAWPTVSPPPAPYQPPLYPPPPPQYGGHPHPAFACNGCMIDLTYRPRIRCHECPNYDICSTCYLTRQAPPPHEEWHKQQTYLPANPPRHVPNPKASFTCDGCGADVSAAPRARCLECINLDLCGDCHIMKSNGPPGIGHLPTHKMNVITDWQPETRQMLVNEDYYPSNLYLDMIDAIFNFIHKTYNPPLGGGVGEAGISRTGSQGSSSQGSNSTPSSPASYSSARSVPGGAGPGGAGAGVFAQSDAAVPREQRVEFEVLEATKLARFYRAMGMKDKDNSYLVPTATLSKIYSRLGLEYILIPSPALRGTLSDRVFPWQVDHLDTTPTEPALTRAGFKRSFVLGTFLNPEGTFFILQNLLSTGMLVNPMTGVPFKNWVPRETLPMKELAELVEWERGLHVSGY